MTDHLHLLQIPFTISITDTFHTTMTQYDGLEDTGEEYSV